MKRYTWKVFSFPLLVLQLGYSVCGCNVLRARAVVVVEKRWGTPHDVEEEGKRKVGKDQKSEKKNGGRGATKYQVGRVLGPLARRKGKQREGGKY
jgi:hypothetical protein